MSEPRLPFAPVPDAQLGGGGPWIRTSQVPGPAGTAVDGYQSPTGEQVRVLVAAAGTQPAVDLVAAADRAQLLTVGNVTPLRARGVGGDGSVWVALDDYRLPTVADLTRTGQRLDPPSAYRAADAVLGVLDAAATAGVHGVAVTPDTVHVSPGGGAPVVDVLSVAVDPARGTVAYAPDGNTGPAVVPGQTTAVGGLLYALLTGRPGVVGAPPPSSVVPGLDPRYDAVPMRALAADPAAHYPTLSLMRADVAATLTAAATAPATAITATMPAVAAPPAAVPPSKRASRAWIVVAVVALLALAGVGLWWFLGRGQQVTVPDVVGKPQAAAQQDLVSAGFAVGTVTTVTSDRAVGTVIAQDPAAGASAATGSAVNLTVAGGQSQVTVPSVIGAQQSEATNALIAARLQLGKVTQVASAQPAGVVVAQAPAAGSTVAVNTKVDLQVSTGQTAVPNVVGQSEAVATATLTNAGFQVTTQQTATAPPGTQAGTVVSQNPAAGSALAANGTVVITVYTPAAPSPTDTASPTTS